MEKTTLSWRSGLKETLKIEVITKIPDSSPVFSSTSVVFFSHITFPVVLDCHFSFGRMRHKRYNEWISFLFHHRLISWEWRRVSQPSVSTSMSSSTCKPRAFFSTSFFTLVVSVTLFSPRVLLPQNPLRTFSLSMSLRQHTRKKEVMRIKDRDSSPVDTTS